LIYIFYEDSNADLMVWFDWKKWSSAGAERRGARREQFRGRQQRGAELLRGAPDIAASTFFNTVNLLPKELRFEHGDAKLASWPWPHLTSLRPWWWWRPNKWRQIRDLGEWP